MNINDLYSELEKQRKLSVSCDSDTEYYSLRAGIYRARAKFLEAFSMIDDTDMEDGFQLVVRYFKQTASVSLELKPKEAPRQWRIIENG